MSEQNNEILTGPGSGGRGLTQAEQELIAQILNKQDISQKGQANGYAGLDGTGKVPSSQLPSYVDDVLEFANLASFPATGESGKIYFAIDTGFTYRWSGSAYVKINDVDLTNYFNKTIDTASQVSYSNTTSGLQGDNLQNATDEITARLKVLENLSTGSGNAGEKYYISSTLTPNVYKASKDFTITSPATIEWTLTTTYQTAFEAETDPLNTTILQSGDWNFDFDYTHNIDKDFDIKVSFYDNTTLLGSVEQSILAGVEKLLLQKTFPQFAFTQNNKLKFKVELKSVHGQVITFYTNDQDKNLHIHTPIVIDTVNSAVQTALNLKQDKIYNYIVETKANLEELAGVVNNQTGIVKAEGQAYIYKTSKWVAISSNELAKFINGQQIAQQYYKEQPVLSDLFKLVTNWTNVATLAELQTAIATANFRIKLTATIILTANLPIANAGYIDLNGFEINTAQDETAPVTMITLNADVYFRNGKINHLKTTNTSNETTIDATNGGFYADSTVTVSAVEFGIKISKGYLGCQLEYSVAGTVSNSMRFIHIATVTGDMFIDGVNFPTQPQVGSTRYTNAILFNPTSYTAGSTVVVRNCTDGETLRQFFISESATVTGIRLVLLNNDFDDLNGGIFTNYANPLDKFEFIVLINNKQGAAAVGNYKGLLYFTAAAGTNQQLGAINKIIPFNNTVTAGALRTGYISLMTDGSGVVALDTARFTDPVTRLADISENETAFSLSKLEQKLTGSINEVRNRSNHIGTQPASTVTQTTITPVNTALANNDTQDVINNKLQGQLNVKQDITFEPISKYGAVGNGTTNDSQAFIDCVNAGFKNIDLGVGKTYLINPVSVKDALFDNDIIFRHTNCIIQWVEGYHEVDKPIKWRAENQHLPKIQATSKVNYTGTTVEFVSSEAYNHIVRINGIASTTALEVGKYIQILVDGAKKNAVSVIADTTSNARWLAGTHKIVAKTADSIDISLVLVPATIDAIFTTGANGLPSITSINFVYIKNSIKFNGCSGLVFNNDKTNVYLSGGIAYSGDYDVKNDTGTLNTHTLLLGSPDVTNGASSNATVFTSQSISIEPYVSFLNASESVIGLGEGVSVNANYLSVSGAKKSGIVSANSKIRAKFMTINGCREEGFQGEINSGNEVTNISLIGNNNGAFILRGAEAGFGGTSGGTVALNKQHGIYAKNGSVNADNLLVCGNGLNADTNPSTSFAGLFAENGAIIQCASAIVRNNNINYKAVNGSQIHGLDASGFNEVLFNVWGANSIINLGGSGTLSTAATKYPQDGENNPTVENLILYYGANQTPTKEDTKLFRILKVLGSLGQGYQFASTSLGELNITFSNGGKVINIKNDGTIHPSDTSGSLNFGRLLNKAGAGIFNKQSSFGDDITSYAQGAVLTLGNRTVNSTQDKIAVHFIGLTTAQIDLVTKVAGMITYDTTKGKFVYQGSTTLQTLATENDLNLKQNITDNTLNTTSKTVVGAINELKIGKNVKKWYVSGGANGSGSDTNSGYSENEAFATLSKLNTVLGNTGEQAVLLPSQLTENVTFTQQNIEIIGSESSVRGFCGTAGIITSNHSASSQTYKNFFCGGFVKQGGAYVMLHNLNITNSLSDSGSGTIDAYNLTFNNTTPISITGTGVKNFYNQRGGVFTVDNSSASVNVVTYDYIAQFTLTAGLLALKNAIVYITQGTTFAIGSAGATFIAENVRFLYPDNTLAKINIPAGVNYSLQNNCIYDVANSTLSGTNIASLYKGYFDNITVNTVNLKSGTANQSLELDANKNIISVAKNTANNKNYSTTATDIKMNGVQSLGVLDTLPRADHTHPSDTSKQNTIPDGNNINQTRSTIASAAIVNLNTATSDVVNITGTTAITGFTLTNGVKKILVFSGALTLTHNATSLILPTSANITTSANDSCVVIGTANGVQITSYQRANGTPLSNSGYIINDLSGYNTVSAPAIAAVSNQFVAQGGRNYIQNGDFLTFNTANANTNLNNTDSNKAPTGTQAPTLQYFPNWYVTSNDANSRISLSQTEFLGKKYARFQATVGGNGEAFNQRLTGILPKILNKNVTFSFLFRTTDTNIGNVYQARLSYSVDGVATPVFLGSFAINIAAASANLSGSNNVPLLFTQAVSIQGNTTIEERIARRIQIRNFVLSAPPATPTSTLSTPPASPTVGATHIVGTAPTGAWSGISPGTVVQWNGSAWVTVIALNDAYVVGTAPAGAWAGFAVNSIATWNGANWVNSAGSFSNGFLQFEIQKFSGTDFAQFDIGEVQMEEGLLTTSFEYKNTNINKLLDNVANTGTIPADMVTGGGSTDAFLNGGNTFGANSKLGTNDNFGLAFETNGADRMTITNAGNVGIGTTSPSVLLHVRHGSANQSLARFHDSASHGLYIDGWTSGANINPVTANDNLYFGRDVAFSNVIFQTGNVGIGTTAPAEKLHVVGTVKAGGDAVGNVRLLPGTTTNSGHVGFFKGDGTTRLGYIGWDNTNITYQAENGAKHIFNGGNVGIGTTAPGETFDLVGAARIRTAAGFGMRFASDAAANYIQSAGNGMANGADLRFTSMFAGATWMTIANTGNVGIGTTTPSSLLHINGSVSGTTTTSANYLQTIVNANGAGGGIFIQLAGGGNVNRFMQMMNGVNEIGVIHGNGGGGVTYFSGSDMRLKNDLGESKYGLSDIMRVKVHKYKWKESGLEDNGFFAQELYEIYPLAVSKGDTGKKVKQTWMVDYGRLTPLIIVSIQELAKKVEELEAKLGITPQNAQENTIEVAHKNEYTQIPPLQQYNDGTTQAFNDVLGIWEYTFKGENLLAYEQGIELQNAKENKINILKEAFENNKVYIIENGETLVIDNNSKTPDGNNAKDLFNNILEQALNMPAGQNDTSVKFYQQQVGKDIFKISAVNTIWQYLLKDLFYFTQNGLLYRIREYNKCLYDEKLNKINNAVTLDELNAITWNFIEHKKINVDEVAKSLLQDNAIAEPVKALIRLRETPVGSGHYQLIEKL